MVSILSCIPLNLLAAGDPLEDVLPHTLFKVFGLFEVNNQMVMAVVAAVIMLLTFPALFAHADRRVPTGAKNFLESILEFLRVEVFRPALKEKTDDYVPFLWTLFFFILLCNLLGQIPTGEILYLITHKKMFLDWGGTATGAITTTAALAIVTFFFIHLSGILTITRDLMNGTYGHHGHHEEHSSEGGHGHEAAVDMEHVRGDALAADVPANFKALGNPTKHYADDEYIDHKHAEADHGHLHDHDEDPGPKMNPVLAVLASVPLYLWNFAPHPFKPGPGDSPIMWIPDVLMWAFLLVLEIIGALIKPFALMVRLFANMIAGHIALASLVLLIPLTSGVVAELGIGAPITLLSVFIRVLELFVAFLQAYIFTFLATLFIASAVAPEH